jgi:polyisoprenyl-phosphate glycosyltransferase
MILAPSGKIYSVVVPVYKNEEYIPLLIREFGSIRDRVLREFGMVTEFVFVVDASPDRCHALLRDALPVANFQSQLLLHARNFGSFSAIRTGLQAARGDYMAVTAADLQEPPGLLVQFLRELLRGDREVVVGLREERNDPAMSRAASNVFWRAYRKFVIHDMPRGGVDVFGCTRRVRDELLALREAHSSLVGQIFWLGFTRQEIGYVRRAREFGRSAWTFRKKLKYLFDSVFAFSDLPIRVISLLGMLGVIAAMALGALVTASRVLGGIDLPGYSATIITIVFFGALNTLSIGLVGSYIWRTYENTKQRPLAVVEHQQCFGDPNTHVPAMMQLEDIVAGRRDRNHGP